MPEQEETQQLPQGEDTPKQQLLVPFTGKWDPVHDPILVDKGDFSDIQNFRYTEYGLKGVSGYTKINTVAIP